MKRKLLIIIISMFCLVGCETREDVIKYMDKETIEKLSSTTEIKVTTGDDILGTITNTEAINKILEIIASSKITGDTFLLDGHAFNLEMYDNDNLIDTIYVWQDGKRLMPKSIDGDGYYSVSSLINIKEIIEEETDFKFYGIKDLSDNCDTALELIYEDDKYKYYFECIKSDKVIIYFDTSGLEMTLKEALDNKYIKVDEILKSYPELLIKRKK